MFSRRLPWHLRRNRLSLLLQEKRERGVPLLDLTESNPTHVGLEYPAAALAAALADPGIAAYRPEPRGDPAARRAVADHLARRGSAVPPERIVLTSSTSEAYALLFKLLADPGESVLVPRPSYPLFEYLAALESVRADTYPLIHDGRWSVDLAALESAVGPGEDTTARAIVVVNPNNPTGSALRPAERAALAELAARRGLAVISDEVFFDYLWDDAGAVSMRRATPAPGSSGGPGGLVFALGGLSKSCGLPQMKLGWIVVDGPDPLATEALARLELIADTYLSVGTPVQRAAARLLEIGEGIRATVRERILRNRAALLAAARSAPACRVLEGDGGWSAVLRIPAVIPEEDLVLALLAQDDVLAHPGYFFDFPEEAYLVLSLLPAPDLFDEGVRRLLARAGHA
jgi:hypothetical protein